MISLYVGRSYYFNTEQFHDEMTVCIHEDRKRVETYMAKIRGLPLVNTRDPKNDELGILMEELSSLGKGGIIPVGEITEYTFYDNMAAEEFANSAANDGYWLIPHFGSINRKFTNGLQKKESKDVYVPEVVEKIILEEWDHFRGELAICSHTLKTLGYYLHETKHAPGLFAAIETIKNVNTELIDITTTIGRQHPILFCSEPEYRARLKQEFEFAQMRQDYYYHLEND